MNKQSNFLLLCIFLLISLFSLAAERPPESSGYNYISRQKNVADETALELLPDFSGRELFMEELETLAPEKCLEMLYTMPLPDRDGDELLLYLFNRISGISSMTGIEYYSHNAKGMTLYLEECFLVSRKGSKKQLPDRTYSRLPGSEEFIIYQKDTTFGSNWYQVDITLAEDGFIFSMTNISTMRYMLFPVLGSGGINIDLIVLPGEETLQLYTIAQMEFAEKEAFGKTISLPGVFNHRMSAIQGWFAGQIYSDPVPGKLPEPQ